MGALKTREWKTREWKTWHQVTGVENAGVENEGVECALNETHEASPATMSESSESPPTAAAATDDCCEVCLVAAREGFALVPCGHAGFCESCALRVADLDSWCSVCRAPIRMVMRVFTRATLC